MLLQLKRAPEVESAFEVSIDSLTDKSVRVLDHGHRLP